jgi:hypothetical protein
LTIEAMVKKTTYWKELMEIANKNEINHITEISFVFLEEIGMFEEYNLIEEFSKRVEK